MNDYISIQDLDETRQYIVGSENPILFVVEQGDINFCGQVIDGIFGYLVGREHPNIGKMIRDFINYESCQGRTPFVFLFDGASPPAVTCNNHEQEGWLVHASDAEAGESIIKMGRLCSRSYLRANGLPFRQFGREDLGEPDDYSDLVNFAPINQPGPEVVVASKQQEKFCSEAEVYTPGVRFYFHISSLVSQPNYVTFLGGHAIRHFLILDKVDHLVVTVAELNNNRQWTPKSFTEAADTLFEKKISNNAMHR